MKTQELTGKEKSALSCKIANMLLAKGQAKSKGEAQKLAWRKVNMKKASLSSMVREWIATVDKKSFIKIVNAHQAFQTTYKVTIHYSRFNELWLTSN